MKIGAIGDLHGRHFWKDIVNKNPDISNWIFAGDYCDSFTYSNVEILHNLKEVVHFAKSNPDKVTLLIGNHDFQYMYTNFRCSGYRPEAYYELGKIFHDNYDIFKVAFSIKNYLFTHAGVTLKWLEQIGHPYDGDLEDTVNTINQFTEFGKGQHYLWQVSEKRGGFRYDAGSCIWNDESETIKYGLLPNVTQVFGHSHVDCISHVEVGNEGYYAIDVLGTNPEEFLKLEI